MMDETMSSQDHLTKTGDICNQLLAIGHKMEEEDMVVITLKILPVIWAFPRNTQHHIYNVDLKFNNLCNELLQQDKWKKQFDTNSDSTSVEQAFATKDKGKGKWSQKKGQGNFDDTSKNLKIITYLYCGKLVHIKKHYKKRLFDHKSIQGVSRQKAHVTKHTEQESTFFAFIAKRPVDQVKSFVSYIDLGASWHFTYKKDWFTKYTTCSNSLIFDDGEEYTIFGRDNVQITFGGKNLLFLNVYHVLSMELNLLSVSQIMCHCPMLDVIFSTHKCHIVDKESKKTLHLDWKIMVCIGLLLQKRLKSVH